MGTVACFRGWKEYESNIHSLRVKKGLTVAALAKAAGCSSGQVVSLANGTSSPQNENTGKVSKSAIGVAQALDARLDEVFPSYFCGMTPKIDDESLLTMTVSSGTLSYVDPAGEYEMAEMAVVLSAVIDTLSKRESQVIRMRFLEGLSLGECGAVLCVSREYVRQLEKKALNRLRHSSRAERLLPYSQQSRSKDANK